MERNVFAILLAAGEGRRMNHDTPKQYLSLFGKPLFLSSLKTFAKLIEVHHIILVIHPIWDYAIQDLIKNENWISKVNLIKGGTSRHQSIINALNFINSNFNANDFDIVLTHDAARPFVSQSIILNNITKLSNNEAEVVSTGIVPTDTIASIRNGLIDNVFNRNNLLIEQTPQSAFLKVFNEIYFETKWDDLILKEATDFCKLANLCNKKICYVIGDKLNYKITDDFDLEMAKWFLKKQ